jgi:hypothetical protein
MQKVSHWSGYVRGCQGEEVIVSKDITISHKRIGPAMPLVSPGMRRTKGMEWYAPDSFMQVGVK